MVKVPNQSVDEHKFAALGQDEDWHEAQNDNVIGQPGQVLENVVSGNEAMMGDLVDDSENEDMYDKHPTAKGTVVDDLVYGHVMDTDNGTNMAHNENEGVFDTQSIAQNEEV